MCFTGSVATGRKVAEACARRFIPAFLELGGKDPVIVLASADPDRAAAIGAARLGAGHGPGLPVPGAGVRGRSASRTAFLERLVARAEAVPLNYPDSRRGQVGPLIFARQAEIIAAQLGRCGGEGRPHPDGRRHREPRWRLWLRPTVVTGVTHAMALMTEETFGPVMPVMPTSDMDEAVRLANDSDLRAVRRRAR